MKKRNFLSKLICLQLVLTFMIGLTSISFADSSEPLALVKSSLTNGAVDVATDLQIDLEFTKNIRSSQDVIDHNKSCVSLKDSAGNNIDIEVIMEVAGKDQPDSVKRTMIVKTVKSLKNNTAYSLIIKGGSEGLKANNSSLIMDKDEVINFTTVKGPEVVEPENPGESTEPGDPEENPQEPVNPGESDNDSFEDTNKPEDDAQVPSDTEEDDAQVPSDIEEDNTNDDTNKGEDNQIEDVENVGSNDNPKTGDPITIGMYAGAMLLSSGVLIRSKRK